MLFGFQEKFIYRIIIGCQRIPLGSLDLAFSCSCQNSFMKGSEMLQELITDSRPSC